MITGPRPPVRPPGAATTFALWVAGLVAVVVASFLPWLRSGGTDRSSYQVVGVGRRRLPDAPGWLEAFLHAWPFLGPVVGVSIALAASGIQFHRTGLRVAAGVLGAVVSLVAGAVGVTMLVLSSRLQTAMVTIPVPAPWITVVGATAALVTSVLLIGSRRRFVTGWTHRGQDR